MSLRKLATLSTMTGLLMIGFAVLAGCDDNKIEEAHLPPNIGTDPATGGQAPTVNVNSTGTGGASAGSTAGGGGGAGQTYRTKLGFVLPLNCNADDVNCIEVDGTSKFGCQADAQAYFVALAAATGQADCKQLDQGGIAGKACENPPTGVTLAQWNTNCLP